MFLLFDAEVSLTYPPPTSYHLNSETLSYITEHICSRIYTLALGDVARLGLIS
jgi:hypothetical protein